MGRDHQEPGFAAVFGQLTLSAASTALQTYWLTSARTTIGRRASNLLVLDDLTVSGEHAVLMVGQHEVIIQDLGSRNGTLVNGAPIARALLMDGDCIDIGVYRLVFRRSLQYPWPGKTMAAPFQRDAVSGQPLSPDGRTPAPVADRSGKRLSTVARLGELLQAAHFLPQPAERGREDGPIQRGRLASAGDEAGHRQAGDDAPGSQQRDMHVPGSQAGNSQSSQSSQPGSSAAGASLAGSIRPAGSAQAGGGSAGNSPAGHSSAGDWPAGGSQAGDAPTGSVQPGSGLPGAGLVGSDGRFTPWPDARQALSGFIPGFARAPRLLPASPHETARALPPRHRTPLQAPGDFQGVTLRFLGGHDAGRLLLIDRPIVSIRNGSGQVAVVSSRPAGFYLTHVEGQAYPLVNGESIGLAAHPLRHHDLIELSGTIIQFCQPHPHPQSGGGAGGGTAPLPGGGQGG